MGGFVSYVHQEPTPSSQYLKLVRESAYHVRRAELFASLGEYGQREDTGELLKALKISSWNALEWKLACNFLLWANPSLNNSCLPRNFNKTTNTPTDTCAKNHDGVLCASCVPDYAHHNRELCRYPHESSIHLLAARSQCNPCIFSIWEMGLMFVNLLQLANILIHIR